MCDMLYNVAGGGSVAGKGSQLYRDMDILLNSEKVHQAKAQTSSSY